MSVAQLSLCVTHCRSTGHTPDAEEIYFLDRLIAHSAIRPDVQTAVRFSTADSALADAFGALVRECRDEHRGKTPPITLQRAADAMYRLQASVEDGRPHLARHTTRYTVTDNLGNVLQPQRADLSGCCLSASDCHTLLTEVSRTRSARPSLRAAQGDTLCLLCGKDILPSARELRAAQLLLSDPVADSAIKQLAAVAPTQLLPETLRRFYGLTLTPQTLFTRTGPHLSDLLDHTPGGWLLTVTTANLPTLQALCEQYVLQLIPYATLTKGKCWVLDPHLSLSFDYPCALLAKLTLANAYTINTDALTATPIAPSSLRSTTCRTGNTDLIMGTWYQSTECAHIGNDVACCSVIPLHRQLSAQVIGDVFSEHLTSLAEANAVTENATVAFSLEIGEDADVPTLWLALLTLYRALSAHALPLLRPHLMITGDGKGSRMTIWTIAPENLSLQEYTTHSASDALPQKEEQRPCSLVHTDAPTVVIVRHASSGDVGSCALRMANAGARVLIQPTDSTHEGATSLADVILGSNIVVLSGDCEELLPILTHRRVTYALEQLLSRDGLLLAAGGAMQAICQSGLVGLSAASLSFAMSPETCVTLCEQEHAPSPLLSASPSSSMEHRAVLYGACAILTDDTRAELHGSVVHVLKNKPNHASTLLLHDGHALLCAQGLQDRHLLAAISYFQ
jgi:hypothetical protein